MLEMLYKMQLRTFKIVKSRNGLCTFVDLEETIVVVEEVDMTQMNSYQPMLLRCV